MRNIVYALLVALLCCGAATPAADTIHPGKPGTDDAVAINAALTSGKKVVFLSAGTFTVATSIKIPDSTTIVGAGMGATTIKIKGGATGTVNVFQNANYTVYGGFQNPTVPDYSTKTPNYNIAIRDLSINCDRSNNSATSNGFIFTLVDGIRIENVDVKGASQKGGYIQAAKNISVTKSRFTGNLLNGLHVTDCILYDIKDNWLEGNGDYAIETGAGDTTSAANPAIGMPAAYGGDGTITGNTVNGGTTVGIYLRGLNSRYIQDVKVSKNTVRNMIGGNIVADPSTGSGIATSNYTQKLEISGNTIEGNANAGVYVFSGTGTGRYKITDNYIYANKNGMNLSGLSSGYVTENHIHSSQAAAMILNYLYSSVVRNNEFIGNGTVTADKSMTIANTQLSYIMGNLFKSEIHTVNISEGTGNASTNTYDGNITPQGNSITSGSSASEGSFTPAITFGGSNTGLVTTQAVGKYTKRDNRVFFNICIILYSKGSSTGNVLVSGLPYPASSTLTGQAVSVRVNTVTSGVGDTMIQGYIPSSSPTSIVLSKMATGGNTQLTNADVTDTTSILISGSYAI